jgi:TonB family protein
MKALVILLLIESLAVTFHASAQQPETAAKTYEIDMYLGVPAETLPEETRKQLKPEEPVLVAFSKTDGTFHANSGDVGLEGTISNNENNKIRVQINDSRYGTTGCPNINVVVGANEPIVPKACAFSSIIFLYYFRVRPMNNLKVPCDGGVLNTLALAEVKPAYPAEAKQAKAEGNVVVRVRIDEHGNVYEVRPCTGNSLLSQSATDAAYRTKFKLTFVSGKPIRVAGVLVYEFRLGEDSGKLYQRDHGPDFK